MKPFQFLVLALMLVSFHVFVSQGASPYFEVLTVLNTTSRGFTVYPTLFCDRTYSTSYLLTANASLSFSFAVLQPDSDCQVRQTGNVPAPFLSLGGSFDALDLPAAFDSVSQTLYVFNGTVVEAIDIRTGLVIHPPLEVRSDIYDSRGLFIDEEGRRMFYAGQLGAIGLIDLNLFSVVREIQVFRRLSYVFAQGNSLFVVSRNTVTNPETIDLDVYDASTLERLRTHVLANDSGSRDNPVVGAYDRFLKVWWVYVQGSLYVVNVNNAQQEEVRSVGVVDAADSLSALSLSLSDQGDSLFLLARGNGRLWLYTFERNCDNSDTVEDFQLTGLRAVEEESQEGIALAACPFVEDQLLVAVRSTQNGSRVDEINVFSGDVIHAVTFEESGIGEYSSSTASYFDEERSLLYLGVSKPIPGIAVIDTVGKMQLQQFQELPEGFTYVASLAYEPVRNKFYAIFFNATNYPFFTQINALSLQVEDMYELPVFDSSQHGTFAIPTLDLYFDPTTNHRRVFFEYDYPNSDLHTQVWMVFDLDIWNGTVLHVIGHYTGNFHPFSNVAIISGTFDGFVTSSSGSPAYSTAHSTVTRVSLADWSTIAVVFQYNASNPSVDTSGALFIDTSQGFADFGQFIVELATNAVSVPSTPVTASFPRANIGTQYFFLHNVVRGVHLSYTPPYAVNATLYVLYQLIYNVTDATWEADLYRSSGLRLGITRSVLFVWTTDYGGSETLLWKISLSPTETERYFSELASRSSDDALRAHTSSALSAEFVSAGSIMMMLLAALN